MKEILEKWKKKRLLSAIKKADDMESVQIIQAIIERYQRQHPEVEPVFVNLPRNDPGECRRILDLLYQSVQPE